MDQALERGTSWEVSHVNLKSIRIIKWWILGDQESFSKLAKLGEQSTSCFSSCRLDSIEKVVDMNEVQGISKMVSDLGNPKEQCASCMGQTGNWSQWNEQVKLLTPIDSIVGLWKLVEHLSGTLRVSNVWNLALASEGSYVVYLGWCIKVTHLGIAELPIGFVFFGIEGSMTQAVLGSSLVSKPNVVSQSG